VLKIEHHLSGARQREGCCTFSYPSFKLSLQILFDFADFDASEVSFFSRYLYEHAGIKGDLVLKPELQGEFKMSCTFEIEIHRLCFAEFTNIYKNKVEKNNA
jgi:hypothetical protein